MSGWNITLILHDTNFILVPSKYLLLGYYTKSANDCQINTYVYK
jgi:hypothetical protein